MNDEKIASIYSEVVSPYGEPINPDKEIYEKKYMDL